jgi:hypothetical protein
VKAWQGNDRPMVNRAGNGTSRDWAGNGYKGASLASLKRGRGCRRCSTTNCCRGQRFSAIGSAFGLKIAAIAKTSNRNACAPPPPSFQDGRRAGDLSML